MLDTFPSGSNALIIGANRGIGLGFVRALLAERNIGRVYTACRLPNLANELVLLNVEHRERIRILAADVTNEEMLSIAADTVRREGDRLHLLINCAGTLHDSSGLAPERKLADVKPENFARSFAVNATGALLVAKHFLPLLTHDARAVLATLSAKVGSIGDNRLGGWYAYRASKAAQNQITRTLAVELARTAPNIIVSALHPGTVSTDLSKPFRGNVAAEKLFTVDRATAQLLGVIDGLTRESSGRFFAWDGAEIPW